MVETICCKPSQNFKFDWNIFLRQEKGCYCIPKSTWKRLKKNFFFWDYLLYLGRIDSRKLLVGGHPKWEAAKWGCAKIFKNLKITGKTLCVQSKSSSKENKNTTWKSFSEKNSAEDSQSNRHNSFRLNNSNDWVMWFLKCYMFITRINHTIP